MLAGEVEGGDVRIQEGTLKSDRQARVRDVGDVTARKGQGRVVDNVGDNFRGRKGSARHAR